ncbi:MAG: sigma-70 family RNA polymerase sigma factor [Acidobacteriota bacterium]|nr:sigma-70 family RNA polymerase sigma factor [Acidobacteriota bacterium]
MGLEFARVLADNQSMVFSLALRFLRDREGAEELAQDVFLQLYRQLDRIESPAHATWWLRRAICHRSIDEVRRRKLRPRIGLEDIPEPAGQTREPDLFLHEQIRRLIESLPEKARMVVLLRYQEDLDPTEIADMLEMPISTVKSHLHRSLRMLRAKLNREEPKQEGEPCRSTTISAQL